MNQLSDLATVNIDDIVKTSKQVQNRVRQDIHALNYSHGNFGDQEDLPPIWDSVTVDPHVQKVVAECLEGSPSTQRTVRSEFSPRTASEMSTKRRDFHVKQPHCDFPRSQAKKIVGYLESYSTELSQTRKLLTTENAICQREPTSTASVNQNARTQRFAKTDSKQTPAKQPKKPELPLQRFAGSSLERIDFSKEHPNLELCTYQSTVFPRRFHKSLEEDSTQRNRDSVNLASAKMREPKIKTSEIAIPILLRVLEQNEKFQKRELLPGEKKTWKEVFKNNKSNEKNAAYPSTTSPKKSSLVDGLRDIDIICTPYKGLYHLEKEGALLSRQAMCSLQRLPVMYIRPECRVQRVAKISIHSNYDVDQEQSRLEMVPSNVGYVECSHEDCSTKASHTLNQRGEDSLREQVSSPKIAKRPAHSSNKFIDALGSNEGKSGNCSSSLQSDMSVPSTVVNSTTGVSSSVQSAMSAMSVVNSTTGESAIEAVGKNIRNNVNEIFNRMTQSNKNQVPTSDMYVQTDFTKTQSESPPVDPTPSKSSQIPSLILSEEVTECSLDTDKESGLDDQTSSSVANTAQSQPRHQTFSLHKESDVTNEFEEFKQNTSEAERRARQRRKKKPVPRVELVLDGTCEESDRCVYPQSTKTGMIFPVKTIGTAPNNSMNTEIKRAVKIFLNSLTLGNGDFYNGNKRRVSNVQHKLNFSRQPETIHLADVLKYDSSASSGKQSEERLDKLHPFDQLTSFSTSSSLSSEVESGNISTRSQKNSSDSLSEGEVLSLGEV